MTAKNWCFTLKAEGNEAKEVIDSLAELTNFYVLQKERAASGYEHYQGYLQLPRKSRISYLRRLLWCEGVNYEIARGSPDDNIKYCTKDDTRIDGPWTGGEPMRKGKRSDLDDVKEMVKEGCTEKEIADKHFSSWCRYRNSFKEYEKLITPPTQPMYVMTDFNAPPIPLDQGVVHLWGPTGTGKTQYAMAHFKSPLMVRHMDQLTQFDPKKHDGIVFDDMTFNHLPPTAVIHLLDWDMPSAIHVRYTTAVIPAKTKRIITSNDRDIFYDETKISVPLVAAIMRRVTQISIPDRLF